MKKALPNTKVTAKLRKSNYTLIPQHYYKIFFLST